jgi:peptide/nickel transport system substrate-binding protein
MLSPKVSSRIFGMAALAIAGMAIFAACSGDDPTATPTTALEAPATSTPEPTGPAVDRLIMAVPSPLEYSNITRIPGQTANWYLRPHYEYLVGFDKNNGEFVPQLATEWNLEPDGHSWRFQLRKGVQFHNGMGEFTAEDVRYSWLINTLPDDVGSEARTLRVIVIDVEIVGPYEVIFHTTGPNADVFEVASEIQGGMEIMSKADHFGRGDGVLAGAAGSELADNEDTRLAELIGGRDPLPDEPPLAGTGPYEIVSMHQLTGIVYEAVEDHWRDEPDFPEFEFKFVGEASTRLAQLLAGDVHLAKLPQELLEEAESRGFKTFTAKVPASRFFLAWQGVYVPAGPNLGNDRVSANGVAAAKSYPAYPDSPLMDVRVRQALNQAIDRDAINDAFFVGKGLTMFKNHYLPDNAQRVGWNPAWEAGFEAAYGYDPAAAKALLAEAGYDESNPLETTMQLISTSAVPAGTDVQQAIAGFWRDIGVVVEETSPDNADRRAKQREMFWDNHIYPVATSGAQLVTVQVYGSSVIPVLYLGMQNPEGEAFIREALSSNTPQDRDDVLRDVGDLYYDLYQDIPLFYLPNEIVGDPEIVSDYIFSGMISGAPVDHLEGLVAK